jgi:hypothetical protein
LTAREHRWSAELDHVIFADRNLRAGAVSLRQIADAMQARGIRAPLGGERWPATVLMVMRRAERAELAKAA